MSENTKIEWCDHVDPFATGRRLGAYKSAAKKVGCSVQEWIDRRLAGLRHCFTCRTWKARTQFTVDRQRPGGLAARCRECMSDASSASRYGISVEELRAFRVANDHRCQICGATDILYIDHCHKTGKLRGLLCPNCNSGIGHFRENPELFIVAIHYLNMHRASKRTASRLIDGRTHDEFPSVTNGI
ncbi:endonuclease VII domain-containing protein [Burkholderia anthina]|uniref:endonuclease VII domain-containing protein n=1 Tax=Burkholderia anthina TaxID=179879 RepID=UPI0018C6096B|nr:endonuclease VII domain-containing protein [Burkholderia anthina]